MKKLALCLINILVFIGFNYAQPDTLKIVEPVYDRPFITIGKAATAIGGYLEGNTNYFSEDGVSEGFSMEMRRFNFFLYSTISQRIRFISELEFEHGVEEIALETAMLDFEIDPALIFRGGILLTPIGDFNLNHDSPKWEFIERPLVSTEIIPSTLSEVGVGFHGNIYFKNNAIIYHAYIVNGLQDGIILNEDGRTLLKNGKSLEMFEEDNNGIPMLSSKISFKNKKLGELGFSYYGGFYNTYLLEGAKIDKKRSLSVIAVDFNTTIMKRLFIKIEAAHNSIDVPEDLKEIFGNKQWGYFADITYPVMKRSILKYENTVLNLNLRSEKIDYNMGTFSSTGGKIYDDITAIAAGISLRPTPNTALRANYRYHWINDVIGNPVRSAGFQFGLASYF